MFLYQHLGYEETFLFYLGVMLLFSVTAPLRDVNIVKLGYFGISLKRHHDPPGIYSGWPQSQGDKRRNQDHRFCINGSKLDTGHHTQP